MSHEHGHVKYFGGGKLTVVILLVFVVISIIVSAPIVPFVQSDTSTEIPVLLPLTGEYASLGQGLKEGMDLAFNETGGRYVPVYYDTQGSKSLAVMYARELYENKQRIILGPALSEEAVAIAPYAEMLGFLMLSPIASASDLTNYPNYVFRLVPSDSFVGNGIVKILSSVGYVHNVTVLWNPNDYGRSQYNAFVEAAKESPLHVTYIPIPLDISKIVDSIVASHPDATYMITSGPDETNALINQFANRVPGDLIGFAADTSYQPAVAQNPYANELFVINPQIRSNNPVFSSQYERVYGKPLSYTYPYYGYDAARMLIAAMDKIGSDPKEVSDLLKQTRYIGVTGAISFDENGDRSPAYSAVMTKDGCWVECSWTDVFTISNSWHEATEKRNG